MRFEWDQTKAHSNMAKHGVSFDEATTVFDDPYARVIEDPDHSIDEERFIILGMSMQAESSLSRIVLGKMERSFV